MTTTAARPRRRRWLLIPAFLLAALAGASVWFYVRGTRVEANPIDPTRVGHITAQVTVDEQGRPCVRAAILLPYPSDAVWAVVTDYENYGRILPYLRDVEVERRQIHRPNFPGCRMTGQARSALPGYWDFDIDIRESETAIRRQALWKKADDGRVLLNRGGWTVVNKDEGQTLLVLTLEAEVKGTPTFLLRNTFLHRLPLVLRAVEARLAQNKAPTE